MTDREIDALVAEKVFERPKLGLLHKDSILNAVIYAGTITHVGCSTCGAGSMSLDGITERCVVRSTPHYSTDPAAALAVVEEMRRRGFHFISTARPSGETFWSVGFVHETLFDPMLSPSRYQMQDASFSRAVCWGALRALGVEVEG